MTKQKALILVTQAIGLAAALVSIASDGDATEICGGPPSNATASLGLSADCWEGPSHAQGLTYARGTLAGTLDDPHRVVIAYAFGKLREAAISGGFSRYEARTDGFTSNNVFTCRATDDFADAVSIGNGDSDCNNTSYALVTAHAF